MVEGLCLSQSMSQLKTFLKLDCWCKLQSLPQIRHRKQVLPPAHSRGAVTFLDSACRYMRERPFAWIHLGRENDIDILYNKSKDDSLQIAMKLS